VWSDARFLGRVSFTDGVVRGVYDGDRVYVVWLMRAAAAAELQKSGQPVPFLTSYSA